MSVGRTKLTEWWRKIDHLVERVSINLKKVCTNGAVKTWQMSTREGILKALDKDALDCTGPFSAAKPPQG